MTDNRQFFAEGSTVKKRFSEADSPPTFYASAVSNTAAKRIANALNVYRHRQQRRKTPQNQEWQKP